jgi:hypothetical protein
LLSLTLKKDKRQGLSFAEQLKSSEIQIVESELGRLEYPHIIFYDEK